MSHDGRFYHVAEAKIKFINTPEALETVISDIQQSFMEVEKEDKLLAFDTECNNEDVLSLIMIATLDKVYIIDFETLKFVVDWTDFSARTFNNHDILKVGFAYGRDLDLMRKDAPQMQIDFFAKSNPFLDLQKTWAFLVEYVKYKFPYEYNDTLADSMQRLAAITLGKPLNKDEANSDWLQRPLTAAQLQSAACGGFSRIEVYQTLNSVAKENGYDLLHPRWQLK